MVRLSHTGLAALVVALAAGIESDHPGGAATMLVQSTLVASRAVAVAHVASPIGALRGASRDTTADQSGKTVVNPYMSYDSASKSVAITLVAAANSAQGGFNFNGGSSGNQTITVPLGWTVEIDFQNHDVVPHSALLTAAQSPLPAVPDKPAFPRAYTSHLIDGLPAQTGQDNVQFTANGAGDYLIACGVPGHAQSGMFIRFVVSDSATVPTDTGTIATP
jgi:sulfocyanin